VLSLQQQRKNRLNWSVFRLQQQKRFDDEAAQQQREKTGSMGRPAATANRFDGEAAQQQRKNPFNQSALWQAEKQQSVRWICSTAVKYVV